MGELSYSLYLTHGLVMYVWFNLLHLHDFSQSMTAYVWTYPLVLVFVVMFAVIGYNCIEKPLMHRPNYRRDATTVLQS